MKRKVIINRLPKARYGFANPGDLSTGLGFNANSFPWPVLAGKMGKPELQVNKTLQPVPRELANLEAEKGEVAMLPAYGGIPDTFKIGGKRHHSGGTPLNLPKESFIFSDTAKMKIKDPDILKQFGMSMKKGGYTPAQIAKKFDIGGFKKVLYDKDADRIQKDTAEQMIANYNMKLAKLALLQESMKGFPQGIPMVAMPYIEEMGIDPAQFSEYEGQEEEMAEEVEVEELEGPEIAKYGSIIQRLKAMKQGGSFDTYQFGGGRRRGRRRETYVMNPQTGQVEVLDGRGRVIGVVNMPTPVYNQQFPIYNQGTVTTPTQTETTSEKEVTTTKTTTAKSKLPDDAVIVSEEEAKTLSLDAVKKGNVYVEDDQGRYKKATGFKAVKGSKSGLEDYEATGKSVDADIDRAEQILDRISKGISFDGKKTKLVGARLEDISGTGKKGWRINPEAAGLLSIEEKEFLTGLSSVGSGLERPNKKGQYYLGAANEDGSKQFIIKVQSENKALGTYGWANGEYLEYQFFKALPQNRGKSAADFMALSPEEKVANRKGMFDFYGFDTGKYTEDQWNNPDKLYTKEIFTGKGKQVDVQRDETTGRITNTEDIGIVGANQAIFKGLDQYRPSQGDDYKLGLEHLDSFELDPTYGDLIEGEEEEKVSKKDEVIAKHLEQTYPEFPAEWWLQDKVKTAAAARNLLNLKKYYPWQATADVMTPDVTFYDPTRELAATAEQSRQLVDSLAQFTGPQALSSRASDIQGQAAKQAADTLSRYHNLNVGISNQQAAQNAAIMNQAAKEKAMADTMLWDKYQTVNQQFDTSKTQARDALTQQYVNAITNRAYTANLNQMYPQYAIDPTTGGMMYFRDPRDLTPQEAQGQTAAAIYERLLSEHPTWQKSEEGHKMAWEAAKLEAGIPTTNLEGMANYERARGVVPSYGTLAGGMRGMGYPM